MLLEHMASHLTPAQSWPSKRSPSAADNAKPSVAPAQVHLRRGRMLLALQAAKRALELDPASPEAHVLVVRLCHAVLAQQVCVPCPSDALCTVLCAKHLQRRMPLR